MLRRVTALTLILLLGSLYTAPGLAFCFFNLPIANSNNAAFTGFSPNPAEVRCKIWILGKGVPESSGGGGKVAGAPSPTGYDSGTMTASAAPTSECHPDEFNAKNMLYQMGGCAGTNDMYLVITDWNYADFDGCPNSLTDRVVVFAEDAAGRYGILSNSANWSGLDDIPTQTAVEYPWVGVATRTSPAGESPVTLDVTLEGLPTHGLGGYAPGDLPPRPLIAGYEIFYQHADSEPSSSLSASWIPCKNGLVKEAVPGLVRGVEAPLPPAGKDLYLLSRMVFESGYKASSGSKPYLVSEEQLLSKIFAFVEATPTEVNWVSGKEEQVVSYQLYWTPEVIHPFQAVGEPTRARGGESSYAAPLAVPKQFQTFLVRVRAEKKDKSFEWSRTQFVDRTPPPPKPKEPGGPSPVPPQAP